MPKHEKQMPKKHNFTTQLWNSMQSSNLQSLLSRKIWLSHASETLKIKIFHKSIYEHTSLQQQKKTTVGQHFSLDCRKITETTLFRLNNSDAKLSNYVFQNKKSMCSNDPYLPYLQDFS